MAETIRTKSELLALYADNSSGNISAEDLRDFVISNHVSDKQVETSPGQQASSLNDVFVCDVGATSMTLPSAATYGDRELTVVNASGGDVTISPDVGDTVDGQTSLTLAAKQFVIVGPKTNDWLVLVMTSAPVDWSVELRAGSVAAQEPSGLDTPLQIEFGAAQALTHVSLGTNGDITFNTAGTYHVTAIFTFGRTTSPGVAMMFLRATFNGSPLGAVISVAMSGSDVIVPVAFSNIFAVSATNVLGIEIIRDSSGTNNGGLVTVNPDAVGWNDSSSSTLVVSRLV